MSAYRYGRGALRFVLCTKPWVCDIAYGESPDPRTVTRVDGDLPVVMWQRFATEEVV